MVVTAEREGNCEMSLNEGMTSHVLSRLVVHCSFNFQNESRSFSKETSSVLEASNLTDF